jgi:hypothetical protein
MAHDFLFFEPKFQMTSKVETVDISRLISYKIQDENSL